tara:strand:- start:613 stop:1809 length:1197 start_codon:yes stop_codon:yes gene_type:complete
MAFNFMSFLGGAAEKLTDVIETREQERLYDARLERESERELSVFEEKEKIRAERDLAKETEDLKKITEKAAEKLSLYYTPKQTTEILAEGLEATNWAISYAENLPSDMDASTSYEMPNNKVQSSYSFDINDPRGSQLNVEQSDLEGAKIGQELLQEELKPFTTRFKEPDKKNKSKATTYQARLLELENQMAAAETEEELTSLKDTWQTTFDNYALFTNAKDANGNKSNYNINETTSLKIINERKKGLVNPNSWVVKSLKEDRAQIMSGNDGNVFSLERKALESVKNDYVSILSQDEIFNNIVNSEVENLNFRINSFKNVRKKLVDRDTDGNPISNTPIKVGTGANAAKHYPIDVTKPMTKKDIENSNFPNNSTVEYYVTKDGKQQLRIAIISDNGNIY